MHMQRKWSSGVLFSLLFTLLLTACSSGGGDSAAPVAPVVPAGTAEGLWTGMTTGTTGGGRTIGGVVLDDGTYWFLYSAVGNPVLMAGALQGGGSSQNGTFASSNGLYFRNDGTKEILDVDVTGPYVMQRVLSGMLTFVNAGGGTLAFTSTFDPEYDVAPDIDDVVGTYPGSAFGFAHTLTVDPPTVPPTVPPSSVITVTATGVAYRNGAVSVTGIELGCDFTGTLSPRSDGNVYNISLTPTNNANAIHCAPDTLTGVAFFDADPAATTKISVLALNITRSRVFPFTGTKQP